MTKRLIIAGAGLMGTLVLGGCWTAEDSGPMSTSEAHGINLDARQNGLMTAWRPVAEYAPPRHGKAHAVLWHCGIRLQGYPKNMWEMERPPFDATNAPASFTGTGTVRVVDGDGALDNADRLVYRDNGGQRLVFVPGRLVPPVVCD